MGCHGISGTLRADPGQGIGNGRDLIAERRQRAGCPTELEHERGIERSSARLAGSSERRAARRFQTKGRGRGLLKPGASRHRRRRGVAASGRPRSSRARGFRRCAGTASRSCSASAVSMTSWLVAPRVRSVRNPHRRPTASRQVAHQWNSDIAVAGGLTGQGSAVIPISARATARMSAEDTMAGMTPLSSASSDRQRDLDVEQGLQKVRSQPDAVIKCRSRPFALLALHDHIELVLAACRGLAR